jgi:adenylate cyclase
LVRVKGKVQGIRIHELLGEGEPDPELARFLALYHQALALYREKRFQDCQAAFAQALELRPADSLCKRYLTLAQKYHETPPPHDWEAVTIMEEK